jgi:hypothetical protein
MIFGHKRKNQNAIYLCNKWTHYEKDFDSLLPAEILNAKYLFSGLQRLTQGERLYLAMQFRTPQGKRLTDGEMVALKGISLEEHRDIKNGILTKLQAALEDVHEILKDESSEVYSMKDFTRAEASCFVLKESKPESQDYSMKDFTRYHARATQ